MNSLLDLLIEEQDLLKDIASAEETKDWTKKEHARESLVDVRAGIKHYLLHLGFVDESRMSI